MAIIGALLMRGPKYWEAEAIDLTNKRLREDERLLKNSAQHTVQ